MALEVLGILQPPGLTCVFPMEKSMRINTHIQGVLDIVQIRSAITTRRPTFTRHVRDRSISTQIRLNHSGSIHARNSGDNLIGLIQKLRGTQTSCLCLEVVAIVRHGENQEPQT